MKAEGNQEDRARQRRGDPSGTGIKEAALKVLHLDSRYLSFKSLITFSREKKTHPLIFTTFSEILI